jgi:hypothetical protein
VQCTLLWGLARKDTSFMSGLKGPEFFFFFSWRGKLGAFELHPQSLPTSLDSTNSLVKY